MPHDHATHATAHTSSPPLPAAEDLLLLFADISGYTRFIRDNPYDLAHATWIVNQLIEAVTAALAPDFRLVKLEGDAAFCAADRPPAGLDAPLVAAFEAFQARKAGLAGENVCPCAACVAIGSLDLKILLHRGPVVRFRAGGVEDLSGLPVIVLHRLGKNGVRSSRYLLWTDAVDALGTPLPGPADRRVERYADVGAVPVSVFADLPGPRPVVRAGPVPRGVDFVRKMALWLPLRLRGVPRPA
ncbi:DUF2652 domain-containing protein [Caenispirillum bisanense]|uniref:Guanylate cyclase domain-containing protein n=1 Tax=Caenispirillum bisanense TaxID=414052 RepID=A0A286GST9_9PROT|nr:DUF2652 domain-containing protein [Caenispirillum bisanense]SOD98627.1 Protein of unknown function [Caenispirillum bisanense]